MRSAPSSLSWLFSLQKSFHYSLLITGELLLAATECGRLRERLLLYVSIDPSIRLQSPPSSFLSFENQTGGLQCCSYTMFALAVTMLLSDKVLSSDGWLAAAPDPRPDQLPTPVRCFDI
jgi:hypothetical protein